MSRHHRLLLAAAAIMAAGWIAWNVLLVESDLPSPENQPASPPLSRTPTAPTSVS